MIINENTDDIQFIETSQAMFFNDDFFYTLITTE